jgi:hypothetical protein
VTFSLAFVLRVPYTKHKLVLQVSAAESMVFTYHSAAAVTAVHPVAAAALGGAGVTISGIGFIDSPMLTARFSIALADDNCDSSSSSVTELTAVVLPCLSALQNGGTVVMEVGNNGVDYSSDAVPFFHTAVVHITATGYSAL